MEAVVLAGGLGTRLRAELADVPKPMAPVGGRPFLERLLDYWIAQGMDRAVLALGYKHEAIRSHFGASYRGCEITYSVEARPLGTGGALLHALALLKGKTFLVLNGDTYFAIPFDELAAFHKASEADITLALFRSANPRYTGVALDAAGRVTSFSGKGLANGGVFLFERTALEQYRGKQLSSLENDLLQNHPGPIYGHVFDAPFVDIGVPEDWRAAERIIKAH